MRTTARIAVIGVANAFRRDDGVGWAVLARLRERVTRRPLPPGTVAVTCDGGHVAQPPATSSHGPGLGRRSNSRACPANCAGISSCTPWRAPTPRRAPASPPAVQAAVEPLVRAVESEIAPAPGHREEEAGMTVRRLRGQGIVQGVGFRPFVYRTASASPCGCAPTRRHLPGCALLVPPTAQNQHATEDVLRRLAPRAIGEHDPDDVELTALCERAVRNIDPCISCSTRFLDLTVVHDSEHASGGRDV